MRIRRIVAEEAEGDSVARLYPGDIQQPVTGVAYGRLMLEPGGRAALLAVFSPAYSFFLCEEHSKLTGNLSFQDNLLNILLSQERP